ncbi:hypothetical protein D3C75_1050680 [compost metagenome]
MDTPDPHQCVVAFGIKLAGTQEQIQRLIGIASRIGRTRHLHGLIRCFGPLLNLVEHRAAAVVQLIAARTDTLPRGLATRQRGSKRCQKCDPAHVTISRRS